MLEKIIAFSLRNKLIILLFTLLVIGFGLFPSPKSPLEQCPM